MTILNDKTRNLTSELMHTYTYKEQHTSKREKNTPRTIYISKIVCPERQQTGDIMSTNNIRRQPADYDRHSMTHVLIYADGGGANEGFGTLGMEGIGGIVTFGTAGIGGRVTFGTAGIGGNAAFGTVGTAGIGGIVAAGTAGTAGMGGNVVAAGTAGIGGTVTAGTFGIGGKVAAGIDGTAPAAGTVGTVGTGGFGTAGMPGTAAGAAAGAVSARRRAAWHVLLPASMSAMTSAVAKGADGEVEAMAAAGKSEERRRD
jgi:hypothetical protein